MFLTIKYFIKKKIAPYIWGNISYTTILCFTFIKLETQSEGTNNKFSSKSCRLNAWSWNPACNEGGAQHRLQLFKSFSQAREVIVRGDG